jgi:hypothetical protein
VTDDDLPTTLRRALAPPPLRPDPWSGQKLRTRARQRKEARNRRLNALASVVVVLGLLGGIVGVIGGSTGGSDDSGGGGAGDSAGPTGAALLGTPLSFAVLTLSPTDGAATDPPFLVVDQVVGHTVDGGTLRLTLTHQDAATLSAFTLSGPEQGRQLVVRAGSTVVAGPTPIRGAVTSPLAVPTASEEQARILVEELELRPVAAGLPLGPGALGRPLRLHRVQAIFGGPPCPTPATGGPDPAGLLYAGTCMRIDPTPAFEVTTADDLQVIQPYAGGTWGVRVTLTGPDRTRLPAIGARAAEDWVFLAGGRPLGLPPDEPGKDGAGFTIYFTSEPEVQLAVLRLRP